MRKVLVTAGASGIGKEIAAAFLSAGDSVYTCDINQDALNAAAGELPGLKTGVCDVGDRKQIEAMVADAAAQLGGIDILINNAGIAGPTAPVQDVDPDQWEAVLKVDLTGTFLVTKHAIPHLISSGHGVIVIMSSVAGRFGYPNRSPYSTVKWGLIGFMKTLRWSLALTISAPTPSCPARSTASGSRKSSRAGPMPPAGRSRKSRLRRCRTSRSNIWWTLRI